MNEKIKELIEQSIVDQLTLDEFITELKLNPNEYYGFKISELEKFVELIVGECVEFAYKEADHLEDEFERGRADDLRRWANVMKQHFEGIKS